ncbi:hypothetical protein PC119_g18307 [Phytophthora cactorum]|nr:hypothetical protein PC119_g18307 [Phytophthora cactorum]
MVRVTKQMMQGQPDRMRGLSSKLAVLHGCEGGGVRLRVRASKPVTDFEDRPTVRLAPEVEEKHRTDFDEELLPENSWEQEPATDEFEVQAILDDRVPVSTGTERPVREFKIKWAGYDESSLEPVSNLSCGGLLYDYPLERNRDRRLQIVQVANEV